VVKTGKRSSALRWGRRRLPCHLFLGISEATTATSVAIIGKALLELLEASEAKLPGKDVGKDSILYVLNFLL
jgi:hypothetical protein